MTVDENEHVKHIFMIPILASLEIYKIDTQKMHHRQQNEKHDIDRNPMSSTIFC